MTSGRQVSPRGAEWVVGGGQGGVWGLDIEIKVVVGTESTAVRFRFGEKSGNPCCIRVRGLFRSGEMCFFLRRQDPVGFCNTL